LEDRSVLDLLKSDHTWLNERLAKHYGIPHVYGPRFRRVDLEPSSLQDCHEHEGSRCTPWRVTGHHGAGKLAGLTKKRRASAVNKESGPILTTGRCTVPVTRR